jgi:hypothetical protein
MDGERLLDGRVVEPCRTPRDALSLTPKLGPLLWLLSDPGPEGGEFDHRRFQSDEQRESST